MDIQKYITKKKELRDILFIYLENPEINDEEFDDLIDFIKTNRCLKRKEELRHFLRFISSISTNYHRDINFREKMKYILFYFKDLIKRSLNNVEIYHIFENNKLILLILIENDILVLDEIILHYMRSCDTEDTNYCYFFYPEIKNIINEKEREEIKEILLDQDIDIFDNFEQKRQKGENHSKICYLIRNDLAEEFITYINRNNTKLTSKIPHSIFETNLFLIENRPTLIEYAAFCGSIQIFQFLRLNQIELTSLLWFHVIHSKNAELIHLLEENKVHPPKNDYEECLLESIKCHHNDITNYIKMNLVKQKFDVSDRKKFIEKVFNCSCCYSNYSYFLNDIKQDFLFFYLCFYEYSKLVDLFLKSKNETDIEFDKSSLQKAANKNDVYKMFNLLSKKTIIKDVYFKYNDELTRIAIPSSITSIGFSAFMSCSSLKQISIPSSIKSIENNAFCYCSSLEQISIPSSVTLIPDDCFSYCKSLKKISFSNSVKSIGNNCFKECSSLHQISIPMSVEFIGYNCFENCSSLVQIIIPSLVTTINDFVCNKCNSIQYISLPNSITKIGRKSFCECKSLKKITIPSSVISINENAFADCSSLIEVYFESPSNLSSIGFGAFSKCVSLLNISIPNNTKEIGSCAFEQCKLLTNISLPCTVEKIGISAFEGCELLKQFSIPSNVTEINSYCFNNCSELNQIFIPSSVTYIHSFAFCKCKSLTQISIPSSVTIIDSFPFQECSSLEKITFPSHLEKYLLDFPENVSLIKY